MTISLGRFFHTKGDMFHSNLVNAEFYADDFDQLHGGADDFDGIMM